ncbi:MAG: hypothetical protein RIQ93_1729 [Verrucomicrobiota bacterium]
MTGLRPFWVLRHNRAGDFRAGYFLYPLLSYSVDENTYKWSVFEIIRRTGRRAQAAAPQTIFDPRGEFEIFPFWFSRVTGDPALSYRALFPIAGTIKNKLGFERLSWVLFPFYVENEKRGAVTTSTPWPIVRVTRGAAHGWGIWPLFNYVDRPGVSRAEYYLWPLGYNVTKHPQPDDPPGAVPRRDIGALPFWARSTGPGFSSESYVWPFFGYTDVTGPEAYHETRYFWPFLVQGRGENRLLNRWAPFYTHSLKKGYDKEWFAWPLVRQGRWNEGKVARRRTQVLFFAYWSETQRAIDRPQAPAATLTHVWPLYSTWDNGAGARQWQVFSPFEVFFPGNEQVRHAWTPFFSLLRYSEAASGEVRANAFWNAITWEENRRETRSEFHLGPLLSVASRGANRRIAIGNGLFGIQHDGSRWRSFWLDFRPNSATNLPASR